MASFMQGIEIVFLAERHGWVNSGSGSNYPFLLKKLGQRSVPIRDKLENRFEVQGVLKQLEIPRTEWPEKLK